MNVTKKNFDEIADEIERLLPSAEFVAIDEEMTGISLPGCEEQVADLPAARYGKMRKEGMKKIDRYWRSVIIKHVGSWEIAGSFVFVCAELWVPQVGPFCWTTIL